MMPTNDPGRPVDSEYYEVVPPGSPAASLLVRARRAIYRDFIRICNPSVSDQILDVGVSDVVGVGDNVLERWYPHQEMVTAVGLGEGVAFKKAFPNVKYSTIRPNEMLPFSDQQFPIAFCNAVIEHVGSVYKQQQFLSELLRVATVAFVVAPNRYFPVEHHTAIPILGWWSPAFRMACGLCGKSRWGLPENLILMSRSSLRALTSARNVVGTGYSGIKLGPFSSNVFSVLKASGDE